MSELKLSIRPETYPVTLWFAVAEINEGEMPERIYGPDGISLSYTPLDQGIERRAITEAVEVVPALLDMVLEIPPGVAVSLAVSWILHRFRDHPIETICIENEWVDFNEEQITRKVTQKITITKE